MISLISKLILILLLPVSIFVEVTFFPFPLFFIIALTLFLLDSNPLIAFYILLSTILLDAARIDHIGVTALAIFCTLVLIFLYKKSLEVTNFIFILVVIGAASFLYSEFSIHYFNVFIYIVFMLISLLSYKKLTHITKS